MTLPMDRQGLKRYALDFVANEEKVIPINGNYFKYESGTGEIKIVTDQGVNVYRGIGGAVKIAEFKNIRITDLSGANDSKVFSVGYGEIDDNAVSGEIDVDNINTLQTVVNPVEIFDKNVSLDKSCFATMVYKTALAGNYSYAGLWNPSDSGVNLLVDKIMYQTVGGYADLRFLTATLGGAIFAKNKYIGEAASKAILEQHNNATSYGTKFGGTVSYLPYGSMTYGAETPVMDNKQKPIIVPPDKGLVLTGGVVGVGLCGWYEWEEKTV